MNLVTSLIIIKNIDIKVKYRIYSHANTCRSFTCPKSKMVWSRWNISLFSFLIVLYSISSIKCDIINKNIVRTIDLSTQLVKESITLSVEDNAGQPIKEYIFVIPGNERKNLAFFSAKDGNKKDLKYKETIKAEDKSSQYTFSFQSNSKTQVFQIDVIYSRYITPHPEEIKQYEKQLVKYNGFLYFYSPYKTTTQTVLIKLGSSNIISHTQAKPYSVTSDKIKFGPYEDIEAFSNALLVVHYENESPFLTVRHLERTIEVSHWGNIALKEDIYLEQTGAKLKGAFSRYEYQKDGRSGQSAVKSYKTILPSSATGVYYRDTNGNISTSNMKILRDSVELELRPRFPLFGGWKTRYTLGYNVPSFEYLFNDNDNYLLRMRIIDHIFDDMVVDEAVIKIILPEGSSNLELTAPYAVNRTENGLYFTYLDTVGRPTITFSKTNLVENHIADFDLKYTFSKMSLLQEPLLVISFIYVIFIVTIIFLRLDFSISTHSHKD